ncbi:hypothetical protein MFMK1_001553 [Metallumcola ferriviriculae]|uniref:Uncharacterized protein n=1 Tax=Metallumcola ferriviriculae TaxID=3039180 RepID=A0AAU0UMC0_9FIRM|nr:hypothetical protein MFMK1_001553 [Desulfitibacteraceae bacterium MK1]
MSKQSKKLLTFLAVILGIGLVIGLLFWVPLQKIPELEKGTEDATFLPKTLKEKDINKELFPQKLGALKLVQLLEGEEAKQNVYKLHGTTMELAGAFVANYASDFEQVTIWASVAPNKKEAKEQVNAMHIKMEISEVFTDHQHAPVGNTLYHSVLGMGQSHLFYQRGDDVIWISVQAKPGNVREFISQTVEFL